MMTSALILACITRQGGAILSGLLGLTAGERFHAVHTLNNDGFVKSGWFTAGMLIVLAGSITALVMVTLYKKLHKNKASKAQKETQNTEYKKLNVERERIQRTESHPVSSIEQRLSAIEQRLTNLEQEVSSFEVIEAGSTPDNGIRGQASSPQDDLNVETQVLATVSRSAGTGGPGKEETK